MTEQASNNVEGEATVSTTATDGKSGGEDQSALATPSAADADETEPVENSGDQQLLKNLLILPPKQKEGTVTQGDGGELLDAIPLPPIRAEEPVSSIKGALGEICGYAHLTNYRLVLEDTPQQSPRRNGKHEKSLPTGPSPYTGCNATVSVPVAVKSLDDDGLGPGGDKPPADPRVLDDYGDLSFQLQSGVLHDGSGFRIVLERYDAASVRDHVVRLRSLFDGNAPSSTSLDEGAVPDKPTKEGGGDEDDPEASPDDPAASTDGNTDTSRPEQKDQAAKDGKEKDSKDAPKIPPKDIPVYPSNQPLTPDTKDLKHFFYYACGEDPTLYSEDGENSNGAVDGNNNSGSKSKKKGKKKNAIKSSNQGGENDNEVTTTEQSVKELLPQLNALEEKTRVQCFIRFSGFHPPPQFRRLVGDLAYLEVTLPGGGETVHVTATPIGFFVNRSSSIHGAYKFDPSPARKPCFSHELLDCLLQFSPNLVDTWTEAQAASRLRSKLMAKVNQDGPFSSFFRVAIRGDFSGYTQPSVAVASEGIDALIQSPSWLVPVTKIEREAKESWTRNCVHAFNPAKTEEDLSSSFGVDVRGGALRDWNEELQVAREMPVDSLLERIERARVMNKVLTDFGEAALLGVKAICEGQVTPMNPNEATRSQVYLHNNIFFSRAVDTGMETFKVAKGDRAARKSASRDLHCLGALHRMDKTGLYTLGTVLVDFLGTRYVCQSILPGILNGEKTHTLLYGAVEAGTPLVWDKEMHELLESTLGAVLRIATRPVPREPLTTERAARIETGKAASLLPSESKEDEKKDDEDAGATIDHCAPLEAKGIRGSDQRKYILDMTRLTPRDANWVREEMGGTGNWERIVQTNGSSKFQSMVPKDLNDDEWTLALLRSELVTVYGQMKMAKYLREKKERGEADDNDKEATEDGQKEKKSLTEDDLEYFKTLRFNLNVFLPDIKSLEGIDEEAFELIKKDEEMVRSASSYLWDEVIPGVTMEIRQGSVNTMPHDGKSLTEFIHLKGINCRYLGRLATLSQIEEQKDRQQMDGFDKNQISKLERRKMPLFWLELLECEMVARSAKHVLDRYLTADGATAASNPSQMVASFLCALVSESEETAAQTENRMDKRNDDEPDEDDLNALTFYQAGGGGDATPCPVRGRFEVWKDIEEDIGRRFRYNLTIFNRSSKTGRVMHVPLLRRVCQRTGVRLAAKSYEIGGKCYCSDGSSGGHIIPSYPISALDVLDIVPLMKHGAAHGEGFVPCSVAPGIGVPPLHISLPDARAALEAAHLHHNKRLLSRALDLAQEAAGLYQRVCETPAHPGVVRCVDLMGTILYDAGEPALAAANAGRALGFQVQISGFDSSDVINLHFVMFQFLIAAGQPSKAVKHIRAAIYLMELMGGHNHAELSNAYHKVGTVYHSVNDLQTALRFFQEATSRESSDRLLEGMISKSSALVFAGVGDFQNAVKSEKRAYKLFSVLFGANHQLTKQSDQALAKLTTTAVAHGNRMVDDLNKKKEEEAAEAIANEIEAEEKAAEEAAEDERRKKRNSKKKKGKK